MLGGSLAHWAYSYFNPSYLNHIKSPQVRPYARLVVVFLMYRTYLDTHIYKPYLHWHHTSSDRLYSLCHLHRDLKHRLSEIPHIP